MRLADVSSLAAELEGVVERRGGGLLDWRYRGRLVARQLDAATSSSERPSTSETSCSIRSPRHSRCQGGTFCDLELVVPATDRLRLRDGFEDMTHEPNPTAGYPAGR